MDSPKEDPNEDLNKGEPNAAPSSPALPPAEEDLPLSNYLANLSPILSGNSGRYIQSFYEANFSGTPSFTSPRLDMDEQSSFFRRDEIDTVGLNVCGQSHFQSTSELIPSFQNDLQSSGNSARGDKYPLSSAGFEPTDYAGRCLRPTNDSPLPWQTRFTGSKLTTEVESFSDKFKRRFGVSLWPDRDNFYESKMSDSFLKPNEQHTGQNARSQFGKLGSGFPYDGAGESYTPVPERSAEDATRRYLHGIRRPLRFEPATCNSAGTFNSHIPSNMKIPVSPHIEQRGVSCSMQAVGRSQLISSQSIFFQSDTSRSVLSDPTFQGIGLNSLSWSRTVDSGINLSKKGPGYASSPEDRLMPGRRHNIPENLIPVSRSGAIRDNFTGRHEESQSAVAARGLQSINNLKQPCGSLHSSTSCEARMSNQENSDWVEGLDQDSSQKKRNRETHDCQREVFIRCSCKKSQCLKMYCDCFKARQYCGDRCSCKLCFNRRYYEGVVSERRRQIELRDPTAFASRIVTQRGSPSNVSGNVNWTTPASARHKRGCNCRKSKCRKKYCECFQANVGCSDGCRCEGCENPFGKKTGTVADYIKSGRTDQLLARWEELPDGVQITPFSHPILGSETSSSVPNEIAREGSSIQSSSGLHLWRSQPNEANSVPSPRDMGYDAMRFMGNYTRLRLHPQGSNSGLSQGLGSDHNSLSQAMPPFPAPTPCSDAEISGPPQNESDSLGNNIHEHW